MTQVGDGCAVCGAFETSSAKLSRVVIEGRSLELCRTHAATVVTARPETFEDLRQLFTGMVMDAPRQGPPVERRSPIPRRGSDDRRAFPPRPEGRRMGAGRRATDPSE